MGDVIIEILSRFGVPVLICVVLPVMVVWLITRARQNETNRKAEIMIKAIEAGVPVDMDQFKSAKKKGSTSIKQDLLEKLNGACITGLMGIGLFITYFTGKRMLAKEMEAEERKLEQ